MSKMAVYTVFLLVMLIGCSWKPPVKQTVPHINMEVPYTELSEKNPDLHTWMNEISEKESRWQKEEAVYVYALRNFLENHPQDERIPRIIMKLGDFYFHQTRYEEAVDNYMRIIKNHSSSPYYFDAVAGTALSLSRSGELDSAVSWYGRLNAISGNKRNDEVSQNAGNLFDKARSLERRKKFNEAGELYTQVAERYSTFEFAPRSLLKAGLMREAVGDFSGASKLYQRFNGRFSDSPLLARALYYEANCWKQQGKDMTAAKKYLNIARTFPVSGEAESSLFQAGKAFSRVGEKTVASRAFERYLELYPGGEHSCPAAKEVREIFISLGRRDKAEAMKKKLGEYCERNRKESHEK